MQVLKTQSKVVEQNKSAVSLVLVEVGPVGLLNLPGKVGSLPLSLGTRLALCLKFLFELLNTALHLLDSLLALANNVLLVFQLGGKSSNVPILLHKNSLSVLLLPVQLGNLVLGKLQLPLKLPPLLLNTSTTPLFSLQRTFKLIQGALQLGLHRVEVGDLLLGSLQVVRTLRLVVRQVLLLLVQFVDHFILGLDFVVEGTDGMVPVGLLGLHLLDGQLKILNFLLDNIDTA